MGKKYSAKKIFFITTGSISLGLGILGIFLPLLPTTPFLLLTAACYSKSSEKMLQKLLDNKFLGRYIRDYRENRGIRKHMKVYILSLLWICMLVSILFFAEPLWLKILLALIGAGVTAHILSFKTL